MAKFTLHITYGTTAYYDVVTEHYYREAESSAQAVTLLLSKLGFFDIHQPSKTLHAITLEQLKED